MKYVNLYLIGYVVFVLGLVLAMWKSGILNEIAPVWIGIGVVIAIGIGIMMSVGSGKPTITQD